MTTSQARVDCDLHPNILPEEPIGSVPQNIYSSGQFLLAGRFVKNSLSLEGKCSWKIDNAAFLRGFDVWNSCYVLFVRNLCPHPISYRLSPPPPLLPNGRAEFCPMTTPKLASNIWTYVCWETSQ